MGTYDQQSHSGYTLREDQTPCVWMLHISLFVTYSFQVTHNQGQVETMFKESMLTSKHGRYMITSNSVNTLLPWVGRPGDRAWASRSRRRFVPMQYWGLSGTLCVHHWGDHVGKAGPSQRGLRKSRNHMPSSLLEGL